MTGPEIDDLWKEIIEHNGIGNITPNRIVEAMQTLIEANEEFQRQHAEAIEDWAETLAAKDKEIERLRTVEANLRGGDDSDGLVEARTLAAERLTEIERLAHRAGILDVTIDKKTVEFIDLQMRNTALLKEIEALREQRDALFRSNNDLLAVRRGVQAERDKLQAKLDEAVEFTPEQVAATTKLGASVIPDNDPLKSYDGIETALVEVLAELGKVVGKNPRFNSYHEGWAVLFEEVDELWDEVRKKRPNDAAMRLEARQVAAMALRFMVELVPPFKPTKDATT